MFASLRTLSRNRVFTVAAVSSIALAVGVNAAVFSIASSLWFPQLPLTDPARIVVPYRTVVHSEEGEVLDLQLSISLRQFESVKAFASVTSELNPSGLFADWGAVLRLRADDRPVATQGVAANFFETLGVRVRGRTFRSNEDKPTANTVAIVTERFWRARLRASDAAIGSRLDTSRGPVTIIGVIEGPFVGARLGQAFDIWVPFGSLGQFSDLAGDAAVARLMPVTVYARLKADATVESAQAEARAVADRGTTLRTLADYPFVMRTGRDMTRQTSIVRVLWIAAAMVLALGCANLAALLVARTEGRRHELATRLCLGAGPRSAVYALLSETAWIGMAGLAAGLIVRHWLLQSITTLELSRGLTVSGLAPSQDWRTILFSTVLGVIALGVSVAGGLRLASRVELSTLVATAGPTASKPTLRLRSALLISHVAVSVALLGGAASLGANVYRASTLNLGFARDQTLFVTVRHRLDDDRSSDMHERRWQGYDRLMASILALPDVRDIAYGSHVVGARLTASITRLDVDGVRRDLPLTSLRVGPSYLTALGARFIEGRDFTPADAQRAIEPVDYLKARVESIRQRKPFEAPQRVPVVVIDATAASHLWPGRTAVGRFMTDVHTGIRSEVVGVIAPLRHTSASPEAGTKFEVATRRDDEGAGGVPRFHFAVRTRMNARSVKPAVFAAIRKEIPDAAQLRVDTANELIGEERAQERTGAIVFSWFGLTGALLALSGVYGLVLYLLMRQRREFGIRVALGASTRALRRRLLNRIVASVFAGALVGMALGAVQGRYLAAIVPGLAAVPQWPYLAVVALFVVAAYVAASQGARRAGDVNPAELLRSQ